MLRLNLFFLFGKDYWLNKIFIEKKIVSIGFVWGFYNEIVPVISTFLVIAYSFSGVSFITTI